MRSDEILFMAGKKYNRSDAMPLCSNCDRQPCQMQDIVYAAKQDGLAPEEFTLKYAVELGLNLQNRFLCSDCRTNLQQVQEGGKNGNKI